MKPATVFAALLVFCGATCAALAGSWDDYVYLRRIGSERVAPQRFELLKDRPLFMSADVVRVLARDIGGLETERAHACGIGTIYVVRTSPSVLPDRYEIRTLPPGVSYMQSIGGGGGFASVPLAREFAARRAAASPVARTNAPQPQNGSTPGITRQQGAAAPSSPRPFGWPAYDNPLERRAHR